MSQPRNPTSAAGAVRTIPAACPVCHGSRYTLCVEPAMTTLCGAGLDFSRTRCPRCGGTGLASRIAPADPPDPAYRVALPPHPDLLTGCGDDAISGEIFCGERE